MPDAPPRPSAHPSCDTLVPKGRCKAHERKKDLERGTASQRGYGALWQRARKAHLSRHPLCAECKRNGRDEIATVVDHVIPHRGDRELFWKGPWESLCTTCHNRKTARGE